MELSILLLAIALILVIVGIGLGHEAYPLALVLFLCAGIFGMAGAFVLENDRFEDYEKVLKSFTYEASVSNGEIISAKSCETLNKKKICEVLEYTLKGEGSMTDTIEVVVDDYWEKQ